LKGDVWGGVAHQGKNSPLTRKMNFDFSR